MSAYRLTSRGNARAFGDPEGLVVVVVVVVVETFGAMGSK